jgi:hypothetical protein
MFELNASMLSSAKKEDDLILLPFIIAKAVINKFDKEQDKTITQIKYQLRYFFGMKLELSSFKTELLRSVIITTNKKNTVTAPM